MTFLELCQAVRTGCGIAGTGPVSVVNQTGMHGKIVDWVKQSDLHIQGMYFDWRFMHKSASLSISVNNVEVVSPSDFYHIDKESIIIDDGTDKSDISLLDYRTLRDSIKFNSISGKPDSIAIKPDNNLLLSATSDKSYTLTFDYYKKPVEMTENASLSAIPDMHHRLIILKSKLYFAEDQEADEMSKYILPEYDELLKKLESDQLPGGDIMWYGQNDNLQVVVE